MKFYKVREEILKGKNISNLYLRVTFYARVSTETDEQLNSLDNQISFFENFIKSNSNWSYVNGYVDEGISGSTAKKRKMFLKMIEDAKAGHFDLIVTKEVSRFSRNLSDSIKYTQELAQNEVGVYFQSNGINTYDPNSEFILNMMGSVAQEEIKRLSSRVKWGHKEAIKKGRILGSSSITGYMKENAKLIIVEDEAEKVRKIFNLYASGKYGLYKLGLELFKQGISNNKENPYDKDTLKRIIQNPKYKGFYRGHTTETIDYRTKRRIYIPIEEQIIYKDETIPSIVSEEVWNKANDLLSHRSKLIKSNSGNARKIESKYCYTSKIFCKEHNVSFQRMTNKRNQNKPRWACSNYIKYRLQACHSPIIYETDLNNIFLNIMTKIFKDKTKLVNEMLGYYSSIKIDNNYRNRVDKLFNELRTIKKKKEKILELTIENVLTKSEFKDQNKKYNENIKKINNELKNIQNEQKKLNDPKNIMKIKKSLMREIEFKNNIKEFVEKFVKQIIVIKNEGDRHDIILKIYLNFTKNSKLEYLNSKYINKLGEKLMFKKKIESIIEGRINFVKNQFLIEVYNDE